MKRKISLAFTLLAAIIVMSFSSIVSALTNFSAFRSGLTGILGYVINLAASLAPVALAVLLHFNQKKPMGKAAGLVCLIAGGCELFYAVKATISLFSFFSTGSDIYQVVMYSPLTSVINCVFAGICMVKIGLQLYTGVKTKGLKALIILGAFLIFFVGLLRTVGHASIGDVISPLLTMLMLWHLIPAYTDRGKCAMTSLKAIIIIAIVIAILFIIPEMLNGSSGGSSSGSSRTCGYCGRSFTDSSNKSSIARTNLCTNCYNNYKWASDALGK